MKVRIVAISKESAHYYNDYRKDLIGCTGEFEPSRVLPGGFRSGRFIADKFQGKERIQFYFYGVKVHQLKENEE